MTESASEPQRTEGEETVESLAPRDETGQQFVCYGDSCSGIPGGDFERNLAGVNAALRKLRPSPSWIGFIGDEIMGMTKDYSALRAQWKYWLDHEMAWLDRNRCPVYSVPSNHTTYDEESEAVWKEAHPDVPENGPPGQDGLSYVIRRGNLLIVCMDTSFSGLGGNGHVEHSWLERTLSEHADALYKVVLGHYPAFAVNGYDEYPRWHIVPEEVEKFWRVLVRHGVLAYVCSHVIAFDVQVHSGVLQVTTGGAGTRAGPNGFMRGPNEYHHLVQVALDLLGLRYQVLDSSGHQREWLSWPPVVPSVESWRTLPPDSKVVPSFKTPGPRQERGLSRLLVWRFSGDRHLEMGFDQTLICGSNNEEGPPTLWVGLAGSPARLVVRLLTEPGGSAEEWTGDAIQTGQAFDFQVAVHSGMGPGGIMWRKDDRSPWSTLKSSSARGAELLLWPDRWILGHGRSGPQDTPFSGSGLRSSWHWEDLRLT